MLTDLIGLTVIICLILKQLEEIDWQWPGWGQMLTLQLQKRLVTLTWPWLIVEEDSCGKNNTENFIPAVGEVDSRNQGVHLVKEGSFEKEYLH